MLNKKNININIPSSINYLWNLGSLLGFFFFFQIVSGLLLVLNYMNYSMLAFDYCIELFFDYNSGWLLHSMHANSASLLFMFIYFHMWRSLLYSSYYKKVLWWSGLLLLIMTMMTAFLGYVLPWGQMSYWGTTVITGLVTVVPYIGFDLLNYLWGDKIVSPQTLSRFMVFHFITPFILMAIMMIHMGLLHSYGSNNPFGLHNKIHTNKFNPLHTIKDFWPMILINLLLIWVMLGMPMLCMEMENSLEANPMSTPKHIQPEWYFLFAYAILRSIPNKMGGVLALMMSIMIFFFFSFSSNFINKVYKSMFKNNFYLFLFTFMCLTLLGAAPVEEPYIAISQFMTIMYFSSAYLFILLKML